MLCRAGLSGLFLRPGFQVTRASLIGRFRVLGLSIGHWIIVLIVVVVLFGPKRLPELGQALGEGIRNFKKGLSDSTKPEALPDSKEEKKD